MTLKTSHFHEQLARFGLIGIINVTIDLGGFNILVALFHVYSGPLVGVISIISASLALVNSYLLNRRYTFKVASSHRIEHIHRFAITSVVGIMINSLVVAGVSFLTPHIPLSPHLILSAGKIMGMGSEGLWNFIIYRSWVFAKY